MRNSRFVKVALPFLAGAALIGSTTAPAASAAVPHACGASTAFQKSIVAFLNKYDKGAKTLNGPTGSTIASLTAYLSKASSFFKGAASQWAVAAKGAPPSLKPNFAASVTELNKTAAAFSASASAIKAGKVSAMKADLKQAEAYAKEFEAVLEPLAKKCA